ncbi:MAG TPA: CoA transferase [Acidimicrobiales bacterium]|nr:CoA transferase [Acidimicrobiales bacterium]
MSPVPGPLAGLRVVELSGGLAPPTGIVGYGPAYAGKLFADAGADVWLVEPPEGDPLRRWVAADVPATGPDGRDGALFRFLAASKRSLAGALGDPAVDQLVAGADLVIEGLPAGTVEGAGLLGQPGLVVLSISPFGRGPWQDRPATEMTVQAECGSIGARFYPEAPPLQAGGRIAEWAGGVFGAPAALAAVRHARRTGAGAHIDVSMAEAMCVCTNLFVDLMMSLAGRPAVGSLAASGGEFPAIEQTADGWVGFNTNSAQMFQDFLVLIGRADLTGDRTVRSDPARRPDLERSSREWCMARTTDEIVEEAALFRIPCVPVGHGANLPSNPHLTERRAFTTGADGDFVCPRPPYRLNGAVLPEPGPAPAVGADSGSVPGGRRPAQGASAGQAGPPAGPDLPMADLKVLDLTCWWAGPGATQLFAALGADVIHVEAVQRMDGMRPAAALLFTGKEQWWEYSSFFLSINVNKRGVTLNLDDPAGLEAVHRLIRWADVVIENYTPRVMDRFGLDEKGVHDVNPDAVVVRMPAFGLDGPWRDRVGFAQNMEAMCGMAWVTGIPDGPPRLPRGPCDPIGAMHGAFATQAALMARETSGRGQFVEAALLESGMNVAAEQVVEASAYGAAPRRDGNRSPGAVPQGVFACGPGPDGTERWLAVSVATDAHWDGLRRALGQPEWAAGADLATSAGRAGAQDTLERALAEWAAGQEAGKAAELLLGHGVPAAVVYDFRAVSEHPEFGARRFFEHFDHPVVGRHPVFGMPFRYTGIGSWVHSPAPTLGQHNHEVLTEVLGYTEEEVADLERREVIGTRPLGV